MIIYGIRDASTGEFRYVGRSYDMRERSHGSYSKAVKDWLSSTPHEYVELARVEGDDAAAHEAELDAYLSMIESGNRLLNGERPKPLGKETAHVERIALRLPSALLEQCREFAARDRRTLSAWLRRELEKSIRERLTRG